MSQKHEYRIQAYERIEVEHFFIFNREYCFCGDETPAVVDKMPESDCKAECAGDKNFNCGGTWRNSVYSTGEGELI